MHSDEIFMKRALQLAKNGMATAKPNPSVGAVIVLNNEIIGEGYTSAFGGSHAEVNAIESVSDSLLLKNATIYVTLEPCSHYGKTPPCADLIVKHQLKKVVIGTLDSNTLVSGKGLKRLQNAGIEVEVGVLEKECRYFLRRFFTNKEKKRPYIILKWAETKDGFIAPKIKNKKEPVWISNEISQQWVHKLRATEHAILVGKNTVIEDNPKLSVRKWFGDSPTRVVIDKKNTLSETYIVKDRKVNSIIFIDERVKNQKPKSNLNYEQIDFRKPIAHQICMVLHNRNISSIIIEGGSKTLQTFIDENLWDEAFVFVGSTLFSEGIKAPNFKKKLHSSQFINNDILNRYLND